jgi:hypothetical protein
MRLSLRDPTGVEIDHAVVEDPQDAVYNAMRVLSRRPGLDVGSLLSVDEDDTPRESGTLLVVTAGKLKSIAGRLEAKATAVKQEQPEVAADLLTAARLCRHAIKVGWVVSSVAVAL